jgi:hypothetical protein
MSSEVMKVANSWWMYLLGAVVVLFVLGTSFFFIWNAYRDAKKLNMDKNILKKVIINSAVFTILPSVSILIGVVALAGYIGIPLPWIRLSVIGALHYEGTAVDTVLKTFGVGAVATLEHYVTIALVMTLGIIVGPLFCLFGFKFFDNKVLSKARNQEVVVKESVDEAVEEKEDTKPKKDFGTMLFNALFIAMISAFLADDIKQLAYPEVGGEFSTYVPTSFVPTIVIGATFLSMFICDVLEKKCKQKWLASFSLGLSMLVGMATAAIVEWLVK